VIGALGYKTGISVPFSPIPLEKHNLAVVLIMRRRVPEQARETLEFLEDYCLTISPRRERPSLIDCGGSVIFSAKHSNQENNKMETVIAFRRRMSHCEIIYKKHIYPYAPETV